MISTSRKRLWVAGSSLLAVFVWKMASVIVARELILPSPEATVLYLLELLSQAPAWIAIGSTLRRVLFSFMMNIVLSLITGIASGFSSRIDYLLKPVITVMKAVPLPDLVQFRDGGSFCMYPHRIPCALFGGCHRNPPSG